MTMTLSVAGLAQIRDEIGDEPDNATIRKSFDELGHWLLVAIRVLKRRRAAATAGGGVSQVTVPGAVGVSLSTPQIAALDRQIAALESRYEADSGVDVGDVGLGFSRTVRPLPR